MKRIIGFLVFLVLITVSANTAQAGYYWDKVNTTQGSMIYPLPDNTQTQSIFLLTEQDLYRSLDEGRNWLRINSNPVWHVQITNTDIYSLQGPNEQDLAVFKYQPAQAQWEKFCKVPIGTKVFAVLPNGNILVAKQYNFSSLWQILRSYNNGLSWDDTAYNGGGNILEATPDGTIFTRNNESYFAGRSTDFGEKWKDLNKTYPINKFFISPHYTNDKTVFAIVNERNIYRTLDKGDYWSSAMNGIEDNGKLVSITFSNNYSSDKTMYCAYENGRTFVSKDGSQDWTSLDVELPQSVKLNDICVSSTGKVLAAASDGVYQLIYTSTSVDNYTTVKAKFIVGQLNYKIGGDVWLMDAAPYTFNDRTFVPVRYLAYALGINDSGIQWNSPKNEVTITKDNTTVKLTTAKSIMTVNGKPVVLDVMPQIVDGRIMLPARWIAEAFGAEVYWNAEENSVIIQYREKIINSEE